MISSGFFNSINHDRQYYPSDISRLFNSLIVDGVFQNVENQFITRAGSGMQVIIPSGLAYFNSTWIYNDNDYIQNIDEAPYIANYKRIDGIFLRVYPEDNINTRENTIYYVKGTETGGTPSRPVPTSTDGEVYKPICYISVNYGVTAITQSMITNMVGTSSTPFVSGILKTINADELLRQWDGQFTEWLADEENAYSTWSSNQETSFTNWSNDRRSDFDDWFADIEYVLDGDAAGHLQVEIDNIVLDALVESDEM